MFTDFVFTGLAPVREMFALSLVSVAPTPPQLSPTPTPTRCMFFDAPTNERPCDVLVSGVPDGGGGPRSARGRSSPEEKAYGRPVADKAGKVNANTGGGGGSVWHRFVVFVELLVNV